MEDEGDGTILEALDYDDDDVDMVDADADAANPPDGPEAGRDATEVSTARRDDRGAEGANKVARKRKRRRNRGKRNGGDANESVSIINRFVVDTCRMLKEKKPYLVWNAVGCLGVEAVSDLVKEVNAIQACGGQKTADGSRLRNGGGILWNILKTREPKAYKEIMDKGKEFEKQFRPHKFQKPCEEDKKTTSSPASKTGSREGDEITGTKPDSVAEKRPVFERIRLPVSYDDLFEEGEIA